jgi:hypothetical protein
LSGNWAWLVTIAGARRVTSICGTCSSHAVAFIVAAAIGAVAVRPLYPLFEMQTDNASDAFWAYLLCCFIAGGVGVLITTCILEVPRFVARLRK